MLIRHPFRALAPAVAAVLALGLAACGDGGSTGDSAAADPATREVEGAYGPVEIPVEPQRIVADLVSVDYLTALGVDTSSVVGVFGAEWYAASGDHYLQEFFDEHDVVDPGFQFEADVEKVAAAEPDLILVPFDQIDRSEQREELAKVAPMLVVPTSEGRDPESRFGGTASFQDWRGTLRAYGALLDREDEAEEFIAETDGQLAALEEEHGELISEITATEAKSMPDLVAINALSTARTSGTLGTILMSELGFRSPPAQERVEPDDYGTIELSPENLSLLDGDVLFLEVREGSTRHEDNPLWDRLSVVQEDAVFTVGNHWEFGGAVAAREVISDLDSALDDLAARG
ncbi:ABC transporter substrate-binding protein [Nocardioides sp. SYSU D00038]|uniref:ABC transporter substrate-binding protein n=1 Tax=Nocardioides sp. SYSU D00038 TaxID=2812554 RepID=UPI0019679EEC|nr:ABC transporter substrate-binding protein [Nocardioides sp. SYSU D00038]